MYRILTSSLFISFIAICSYAQNGVSLYGSVIDQNNGEALIGVNIILEGENRGTTTDIDGNFILENIIPGSYNITASYLGYATFTKSNITVISKGNDDLNFELKPKSVEFATVEVVANPFQTSRENPVSIQRLSPEEIKTYPGGNNDIAKVVQSLPGVSGSIGGFRNDVIIRGGAPNENVYYLDGIEIPNINHFSTQGSAGGPVGLLNVDFIEGVELSSSSFGARYDNALSGVLQFDQKIGNTRERQTNIRLSASEAALTTEGPLFKGEKSESNTSYIVSVRRSYLQFLFKAIGLPILPDYWDFQYKVNHKIDNYNSVYLTGIGSIDDFSVNPPDDFDIEQQAVLDQVPIIKQTSNTFGLGWKKLNKTGDGVMNTVFSSNTLNNNFSVFEDNRNLEGLIIENVSRESEQKLRYNYTQFINDWSLAFGGNITYANYTNDSKLLNQGLAYNTDIDFLKYGLHTQLSGTVADGRLDVSIGLRVDDNTYSNQSNKFINTLSPRASISYIIDNESKWRANASIGRYAKILPYTVLGYQDANGDFINRDLPYIINYHSVLGVEYRLGNYGKVSVEGFYKFYENYPISIKDGVSLANKGGDFSVLGNEAINSEGQGRTYGMEVLLQQKLHKNFYGIIAYTLFKSEFTNHTGKFLPSFWDSGNLLTFTGGYKAPKNWEISARYRFAGQTPFAPVDIDLSIATYPELIFDYTNLGSQRLDTYNQLDLRIDKKWNFKKLALNLYLEMQNVLLNKIPSPPSYGLDRDENGAVVQPEALIRIKESDSSFIPVIGMAIDF